MRREELKTVFDRQAAGYDERWARTAPIRDAMYFLLEAAFADLPEDARILSVGAGTGAELAHLARRFPKWSFTAVEPSDAMLDACRTRAEAEGFAPRCRFHGGYVESLPLEEPHHAATCFLVSQFILEREARSGFFREIGLRLRPGGILASSDLASEADPEEREALLRVWLKMMAASGIPPEGLEGMRQAYAKDVAVLPPDTIAGIIQSGGFGKPVRFYQAGMIHAWLSRREPGDAG